VLRFLFSVLAFGPLYERGFFFLTNSMRDLKNEKLYLKFHKLSLLYWEWILSIEIFLIFFNCYASTIQLNLLIFYNFISHFLSHIWWWMCNNWGKLRKSILLLYYSLTQVGFKISTDSLQSHYLWSDILTIYSNCLL
jgi:hypothetical protein